MYFVILKLSVFVLFFNATNALNSQCNLNEQCVPYSNCSKLIDIVENGKLIFCGFNKEPCVCCSSEEIASRMIKTKSLSEEKCEEYSADMKKTSPNPPKFNTSNTNATLGQYPHVSALGYGDILDKIYWNCEGVIISEKFILTVSECLYSDTYGSIKYARVGDVDLKYMPTIYFVVDTYTKDEVALLKLNTNIRFGSYIKPACLFYETQLKTYKIQISGWNFTVNNITRNVLENYEVQLKDCNINEQDKFKTCVISDSFNICKGNFGGALQTYNTTKELHYIIGLSASNFHCITPKTSGTYTQISNYLPWVENITWISTHEDVLDVSSEKCDEYADQIRKATRKKQGPEVFGGEDAGENEFPHMAALGFGNITDIQWMCAGSLISPNFVLTAAHCKSSHLGNVLYVQLGLLNITNGSPNGGIFRLVQEIIVHEKYKPPLVYYDIALIKLNEPVMFSISIKPACLYRDISFTYLSSLKLVFKATGWGSTNFGESSSEILQKVDLNIFGNCTFKVSRRLKQGILRDLQLCAGDYAVGKDTCPGDSGGPLQWYNPLKELHVVIGVTSFGQGCGVVGVPGVYTRVSYFVPWIENIVWP